MPEFSEAELTELTEKSLKEIQGLKNDIKDKEKNLKEANKRYAETLLKGMGNDITEYLTNPPKPDKKLAKKLKRAKKWTIFKENLSRLFFKN